MNTVITSKAEQPNETWHSFPTYKRPTCLQ
jgi:hypothetical protein